MAIINIKNSLHRALLVNWLVISENFSSGWLWLPCALLVVGIEKTFVAIILCTLASMICLLCLLAVRRRRALVLTALKKGMLSFNNNNLQEEKQKTLLENNEDETSSNKEASPVPPNPAATTSGNNHQNYKTRKQERQANKNNNQNSTFDNRTKEIQLVLPNGINSEDDIRLSDLTAEGAKKHWPEGAARMFEGGDFFYSDLTLAELWTFCFGSSKICSNNSSSSFNNNKNAVITFEMAYRIAMEYFEVIIGDVTAFTGLCIDSSHTWCALSVFSILVLPNSSFFGTESELTKEQENMTLFSRYFRTYTHLLVAVVGCGIMMFLASNKFDIKKVRMWFTLAIVGGFVVLGVAQRVYEVYFADGSEGIAHKNLHGQQQYSAIYWKFFATKKNAQEEISSQAENFYAAIQVAKRAVANPSALLEHKDGEFVPVVRQISVFILCAFYTFFSEGAGVKKTPVPTIVDPSCDIVVAASSNNNDNTNNVLGRAKSISVERDVNAAIEQLKKRQQKQYFPAYPNNNDTSNSGDSSASSSQYYLSLLPFFSSADAVTSSSSSSSSSATAVLAKDSVASVSSIYFKILTLRSLWYFIFMVTATWLIPMMSWDTTFATFIGVVMLKLDGDTNAFSSSTSSLSFNQVFVCAFLVRALIFLTILFTVYSFFALALPKSLTRFFGTPTSLYARYPSAKHLLVLAVSILMVESLSSADLNGLRSTAMRRGRGENLDAAKMLQQNDNEDHASNSNPFSTLQLIHRSFNLLLMGQNPWALLAKIHHTLVGFRIISIPLFMYSRSEEALKRLGFPAQMISLRAASLLDNGMARNLAVGWMCLWWYFVWVML